MKDLYRAEIRVELAAKELANKRHDEAETWLRLRVSTMTDRAATAQTVIEMSGAIEEAEAQYEIAKAYLIAAAREE